MEALALVRAQGAPDAEARLEEFARAGAPVRRVLAALAGQLVAKKAWDRLGYVRPRDYAVERLGRSARQVQDLAHEVRALDARSLEAGRLAETDEDGIDERPRTTAWLRVSPRVRARWGRARLLARRVAGAALSQAQTAEVIAAEVLSALGADADAGVATPLHFPRSANGCADQELREASEGAGRRSDFTATAEPSANGARGRFRSSRVQMGAHPTRFRSCRPSWRRCSRTSKRSIRSSSTRGCAARCGSSSGCSPRWPRCC